MQKPVRIVAMSDTHDLHESIKDLPEGEIFIHAGDFTNSSLSDELDRFRQFLKRLPYKHKIVIPGNHDYSLDRQKYDAIHKFRKEKHVQSDMTCEGQIQKLKEVCTYLENQVVEIEGIRIFGCPYKTFYSQYGFMYPTSAMDKIIGKVPENIDVLVTHQPPFGIMDKVPKGNAGNKKLLQFVEKVNPKVHIFGHIHGSYGFQKVNQVKFYNVSSRRDKMIKNPPFVIKMVKNKSIINSHSGQNTHLNEYQ